MTRRPSGRLYNLEGSKECYGCLWPGIEPVASAWHLQV